MTSRADLRDTAVQALMGATDVGARVFSPLDWDTWDGGYPVLIVRAPREEKESLGRGQPQFTVTATIQITGRIQVAANRADVQDLAAEQALERLETQVLAAVINYPPLMAMLQQFAFVRTRTGFSADGEQHLAEVIIEVGMEFYQGPEDFYRVAASPFTLARINDPAVFTDAAFAFPGLQAQAPTPQ